MDKSKENLDMARYFLEDENRNDAFAFVYRYIQNFILNVNEDYRFYLGERIELNQVVFVVEKEDGTAEQLIYYGSFFDFLYTLSMCDQMQFTVHKLNKRVKKT